MITVRKVASGVKCAAPIKPCSKASIRQSTSDRHPQASSHTLSTASIVRTTLRCQVLGAERYFSVGRSVRIVQGLLTVRSKDQGPNLTGTAS